MIAAPPGTYAFYREPDGNLLRECVVAFDTVGVLTGDPVHRALIMSADGFLIPARQPLSFSHMEWGLADILAQ